MLAASAAGQPGGALKPGFNLFSKQQDIQMGQEAAAEVRKQYQVVQNPFLQDYLNRVGRRLAAAPEAAQSGFPFTFTVVNDPTINAFALPGGPMFVQTGLLKAVDNEAQLAGVMGHEMSHVILRHGTNQASKANLLQIPALLAGSMLGNSGSLLGQLAQAGIGFGFNSVLLKFSRTDESQADRLGSHLMAEAGYNPIEMARFFEKLDGEAGSRAPEFLSDHPNPGNREKAIEAEIRTLPQRNYGYQTGEFARARQIAAAIPPPAKKSAGDAAVAPSQPPSNEWQQLRSQKFSVSHPRNWQSLGGDSSMVTIAPRDGLVQNGNNGTAVGLGAILSYFFPDNNSENLQNATDDLIHHLRSQNPGMQVTSRSPRHVRVDGNAGLVTLLEGSSPYGGAETDALLTVSRPEGLFYLVFIAPQRSYKSLEATFQRMIQSLRFS
jgi:Zn-dependent protease with chaperone function